MDDEKDLEQEVTIEPMEQEINDSHNMQSQVGSRLQNISSDNSYQTFNRPSHNPMHPNSPRSMVQNGKNGLNNLRSGRSNSLGNPENHQRPNLGAKPKENQSNQNKPNPNSTNANNATNKGAKNKDTGARNLQNSLANRARNLMKNRKKKKQSQTEGSENSESSDNNGTAQNIMDDLTAKIKRKIRIKIIVITSLIGFAVLVILAVVMAIFGVDISATLPAINQSSYGTDQFTSTYEEDTKEYKDEIKYYEKLKEVSEKNVEENGEEIKKTYVHAVLIYLYYMIDDANQGARENGEVPIDYAKMTKMIEKIVPLMIPSEENKTIDYEKNGEFYNNLKESADFKEYYKEILKEKDINELLDEIFDLAKQLDETEMYDETVITSETKVEVKKENKQETQQLSVNEYLADSIYATSNSIKDSEMVKAYTILYSTNLAANNKNLTIVSNTASIDNDTCSTTKGCSYNSKGKLVEGGGERSSKNTIYYDGKYYYKQPLTQTEITNLNKDINSVFGNVLVKSDGTYPELDSDKLVGLGEGTYKDILKNSYGDYTIKNIGEGSYATDLDFGDKQVFVDVVMYDQSEYTSSFCGLKKETIASSGCGVTSMAMVMSTYEHSSTYTPLWTNDYAKKNKQCGSGRGTDFSHFTSVATKLGYAKPTIYYKNKSNGWKISKSSYNNVLKNLSMGNLVIINVSKGHFTGGGHYMVLGGINPSKQEVYVYDPNNKNNKKNRNSGNGWYSFNSIIVPETKAFIIIKKKG